MIQSEIIKKIIEWAVLLISIFLVAYLSVKNSQLRSEIEILKDREKELLAYSNSKALLSEKITKAKGILKEGDNGIQDFNKINNFLFSDDSSGLLLQNSEPTK